MLATNTLRTVCVRIPDALHRAIKVRAIRTHETLQALFERALRTELKRPQS